MKIKISHFPTKLILSIGITSILFSMVNGQCPDLSKTVSANPAEICVGNYTNAIIHNSETGVYYQVLNVDTPVSGIGLGNGGDLSLNIPASQLLPGSNTFTIEALKNLASPGELPIFKTNKAITIDGIPDEEDWKLVNDSPNISYPTVPPPTEANAQFAALYDDTYLYLSVRVQDNSLPVAPNTAPSDLHTNDAVEFILEAPGGNRKYVLTCTDLINEATVPFDENSITIPSIQHAAHINVFTNVWSGEMKIPWAELGYTSPPAEGYKFKFDSYIDYHDGSELEGQRAWNDPKTYLDINKAGDAILVDPDACDKVLTNKIHVEVSESLPEASSFIAGTDLSETTICPGDNVQLEASGGTSVTWSPVSTLDNPNSFTPIAAPDETTDYTALVSNACGSTPAEVTINVTELAGIKADVGKERLVVDLCQTNVAALEANTPIAGSGTWGFLGDDPLGGEFEDPTNPSTTFSGRQDITYYLTWTVSNPPCEQEQDTIEVSFARCEIDFNIPQGISPNGDGLNDVFEIEKITQCHQLMVFNRSGDLLYEASPYLNDWDGGDLNDGTYYFVLKIYPDDESLETGYLEIRRK